MSEILQVGQNVRHNNKANWGIGKVVTVETCGTVRVIFEGKKNVSIARASKYLTKI